MEKNSATLTTFERVVNDPMAKIIAKELGHTSLAKGNVSETDKWRDGSVLAATVAVIKRLDEAGYSIVPKSLE